MSGRFLPAVLDNGMAQSFGDFMVQKGWKDFPGGVAGTNDWTPADSPEWHIPADGDPNGYGDYFDPRTPAPVMARDDGQDAGPGYEATPKTKGSKGVPPTPDMTKWSSYMSPAPKPKAAPKPKGMLGEAFPGLDHLDDSAFVTGLLDEISRDRVPLNLVSDLHGDKFSPQPTEAIGYVATLVQTPKMMEKLVRELRRHGLMDLLVKELVMHPEAHDQLVAAMDDPRSGPGVAHRLVKAMYDNHRRRLDAVGIGEAVADEVWSGAHETGGAGDAMQGPDFAGDSVDPASLPDDADDDQGGHEQDDSDASPEGDEPASDGGDDAGHEPLADHEEPPPSAHHHLLGHLSQYFPDHVKHHASRS